VWVWVWVWVCVCVCRCVRMRHACVCVRACAFVCVRAGAFVRVRASPDSARRLSELSSDFKIWKRAVTDATDASEKALKRVNEQARHTAARAMNSPCARKGRYFRK
jgi:hypothetical protein